MFFNKREGAQCVHEQMYVKALTVANSQCLSPDKLRAPGKPSGIATHFIQPAAPQELEIITLGKQWWGENKKK